MATMTLRHLVVGSIILFLSTFMATKLYLYLVRKGVGVPIFNHYPGRCRVIPGIECGSEDVAVTKNGLTFISNGFRGLTGCDRNTMTGGIYIFDFENPSANVTKLHIVSDSIDFKEFEPHGLSLWEKENGIVALFAVDHGVSERVQVFEYSPSNPTQLIHKKTIIDDKFVCINDLVVMDESKFYVTNYLKYCKVLGPFKILEGVLSMRTGNVVYFDGSKARIEASNLIIANGINISPGGDYVFVTGSSAGVLYVFARNAENASLTLVREFGLSSLPDNIEVDSDNGDLYIGCHRNQNLLAEDYSGPIVAPSQVLRVRPTDPQWSDITITEILSSDGHNFVRASSVAKLFKGKLLVGTVFHRLALCEDVNVP